MQRSAYGDLSLLEDAGSKGLLLFHRVTGPFAVLTDPPTRVANGSQLMAQEGDSLQLLCTAPSYPPSERSWVKGTRTLEHHGPSSDTWLELTSLTVKDAGQYTCRAKNFLGSVQGIVQLSVACE